MKTLIIGGGLSGLHTAYELHRRGLDFLLIEGRKRLGGRILSKDIEGNGKRPARHKFDLGPAWFWPGQRRMEGLVRELDLQNHVVEQYASGDELVERGPGSIARGQFGVSMRGSFRLRGGMGQLIAELAATLPSAKVLLGTRALELTHRGDGVTVRVEGPDGDATVDGDRVVVALPPRVALSKLRLEPQLDERRCAELRALPTWMAAQGKFVAIYNDAFWRSEGLSGDAISYLGPLGEIHDITPGSDSPAALFGFFGVPAQARRVDRATLGEACVAQLIRLFGESASNPEKMLLKDWAFDTWTTTPEDLIGPAAHAWTGLALPREPAWDGRLLWSGSETASTGERNNGYLEGAVEASERTVGFLTGP